MPFVYDLETDIRFLQGIRKGQLEGLKEGLQEGEEKARKEIVANLLRLGTLSSEQIAAAAGVSLDFIEQIRRQPNV